MHASCNFNQQQVSSAKLSHHPQCEWIMHFHMAVAPGNMISFENTEMLAVYTTSQTGGCHTEGNLLMCDYLCDDSAHSSTAERGHSVCDSHPAGRDVGRPTCGCTERRHPGLQGSHEQKTPH